MKQYQLEITRAIRAERPSQEQIGLDSTQANIGNEAGVSQDKTKDNYFLLNTSMDLQQNVDRILSTMQFNPFAMQMGNGWRVLEYPHSEKWTKDYTHRSETSIDPDTGIEITTYAKVWLQWIKELESGTESFEGETALVDAQTFINTLNSSDGWVLGQEWGKTIVIDSVPSLWHDADYVPLRGSKVNPLLQRNETDRY